MPITSKCVCNPPCSMDVVNVNVLLSCFWSKCCRVGGCGFASVVVLVLWALSQYYCHNTIVTLHCDSTIVHHPVTRGKSIPPH